MKNSDRRFSSVQPSDRYPGMVKRRIPGTDNAIHVFGWGEEVEMVAEEALTKVLARRDARLIEDVHDG